MNDINNSSSTSNSNSNTSTNTNDTINATAEAKRYWAEQQATIVQNQQEIAAIYAGGKVITKVEAGKHYRVEWIGDSVSILRFARRLISGEILEEEHVTSTGLRYWCVDRSVMPPNINTVCVRYDARTLEEVKEEYMVERGFPKKTAYFLRRYATTEWCLNISPCNILHYQDSWGRREARRLYYGIGSANRRAFPVEMDR